MLNWHTSQPQISLLCLYVANKKKPLTFSQTVNYNDPNSTDINSESDGIAEVFQITCGKAIWLQSPKIKTIQSLTKTDRHGRVIP